MEIFCSQCNAPMSCESGHGCWCADFLHVLPVPDEAAKGCLCRSCLTKRIELRVIPSLVPRVERYFPARAGDSAKVLLINPAPTSTPPLDLLKLSTFLRNRGYAPELQRDVLKKNTIEEPYAVVLTSVFSWEIPDVRSALSEVRRLWPRAKTILSGILPRKLGDKVQSELEVSVLDEASEALLDEEIPDYGLVPEWNGAATARRRLNGKE